MDRAHLIFIGKFVELSPESEEVAGFYGALLETDHAKDKVFNKNFFEDFLQVLKKNPPVRKSIFFELMRAHVHMFTARRYKDHEV